MAIATKCQTPDAQYHTHVQTSDDTNPSHVSIAVDIPWRVQIPEDQIKILEVNLHNAVELVLAPYFKGKRDAPTR